MRIGIAGIAGRMGRMLVAELGATPAATLVGGIDRGDGDIDRLAGACDVVIDFTHADTVVAHARALAAARTAWVLGTTGLDAAGQAAVAQACAGIGVVQAANFSPGVTLLTVLAERVAAVLPAAEYDAEITEMHHRHKLDAPSGTALALGQAVAAGRGVALADVARTERSGQTGPRPPGEIGFATLRGGLVVGEHALSFTAGHEQVTLSHRAFDRAVFAAGAVRAALWLNGRPAGLYSMRDVLGM